MKKVFQEKYKKYGKKFIIAYGAWFVLKWTLIFFFGKTIFDWIW